MRISDWSSDVCSSDLRCLRTWSHPLLARRLAPRVRDRRIWLAGTGCEARWKYCSVTPAKAGAAIDVAQDLLRPLPSQGRRSNLRAGEQAGQVEIGRASCRERVCQYVAIPVVAASLKKKK